MSSESFPYGKDEADLDSWVGLGRGKSSSWLAGYHSGVSFGIGAHTILLFGRENLMATVATFYGVGPAVTFGVSGSSANGRPREGGRSHSLSSEGREVRERLEYQRDLKNAREWSTAGDELTSAVDIYKMLSSDGSTFSALKPFEVEEIRGKEGKIVGGSAEVIIAEANAYMIEARTLFIGVSVGNLKGKGEPVLVSAGVGGLGGFWSVGRTFSLWNELAHSHTEEFPFLQYDVHPAFHRWKSPAYGREQIYQNFRRRNELVNEVMDRMVESPGDFGLPDKNTATIRAVEWLNDYEAGGPNRFLAHIDPDNRKYFE